MLYKPRYKDMHADLWPTNYRLGMWAWLFQKVTGIEIIGYGIMHFWGISTALVGVNGQGFDWFAGVAGMTAMSAIADVVTIACIMYHTMNGLRVILMDLGIGVRSHRRIFWGLMAIAFIVWALAAYELLPLIIGRSGTI
ncbi:MAG: succinate dehydrogenase, cytochrome b556 subunit [Chloroflexota bacterium]